MSDPRPFTDRAVALDFIAAVQADPATATAYLGDQAEGIAAELDGLAQDWLDTLRVVSDETGIVGACAIEWDLETRLAWVQGPWAAPAHFTAVAEPLLRSVTGLCPPAVTRFELCADVAHTGMAALAEQLGWTATPTSHVMVASLPGFAEALANRRTGGSRVEPGMTKEASELASDGVRSAGESDVAAIAALHEAEFADSYATADQLLADYLTVVADVEGTIAGYASGQLQADGQAYVDFMVVEPGFRGRGLGRALLAGLTGQLLATGSPSRLQLTVSELRPAALALYESLGMRREASIRGYRGTLTR